MDCLTAHLGRVPYADALVLMRTLGAARQRGEVPDLLLTCEHEPVITLGRGARPEHLLLAQEGLAARGIGLYEVERGGDVTYHGPGQLMLYPILDLTRHGRDLHAFLRGLERVLIETVVAFGVLAAARPGLTGVWVGEAKLASIGIHVSRWVTWHGAALNVSTDLDAFSSIVPCGLAGIRMTSLKALTGWAPPLAAVAEACHAPFARQMACHISPADPETLWDRAAAIPQGATG
ncbi:MAG TPA: lipoyl(octanoyl) transferase LipB [Candidatus Methylomirabilis sp.]|nr:lipoyl(octanoyl) transferase LipB [Candidatus Methylomirabilis sp.]